MSNAATLIGNGVPPRRLVEMSLTLDEPTGELVAEWDRPKPTNVRPGYIDTRRPRGGAVRQTHSYPLNNGKDFGIWFAFQAYGPTNKLLFNIKHPAHRAQVDEMDRRAARQIGPALANALRPKPTLIIAMPSGAQQAGHFAQELGKVTGLPVKTDVFKKTGEVKGTIAARKRDQSRKVFKLIDRTGIEGQSIILADDNVGTGESAAACAEILYANGAAFVHGAAVFKVSGGRKDREEPDVALPFAKEFVKPVAPLAPEEHQADETEDDDDEKESPSTRHKRNLARTLKADLAEMDVSDITVDEIARAYKAEPVEVRFALAQLGKMRQVKPG